MARFLTLFALASTGTLASPLKGSNNNNEPGAGIKYMFSDILKGASKDNLLGNSYDKSAITPPNPNYQSKNLDIIDGLKSILDQKDDQYKSTITPGSSSVYNNQPAPIITSTLSSSTSSSYSTSPAVNVDATTATPTLAPGIGNLNGNANGNGYTINAATDQVNQSPVLSSSINLKSVGSLLCLGLAVILA